MKIAVGCSMKYRSLAIETIHKMVELGLEPLFPNLEHTDKQIDVAETSDEKKRFAVEHYAAVDESDAIYLMIPGGVMGTSLKLELGYAYAKGKPVYFSEPANDLALDWYAKDFVPLDQLERFLDVK